jgi:DNA-binding HxlR family transcriptional regulator
MILIRGRQEGTSLLPKHTAVTAPAAAPASASPAGSGLDHLPTDCARVGEVLSRIGDKWSVMTVMLLRKGPRRFNELKRDIGGVSQRMLTFTLRGLERDGLVTRTVFPTVPPRVDYELTPLGHSLREPTEALGNWVFAHIAAIEKARSDFDAQQAGNKAATPAGKAARPASAARP